MNRFNPIAIAMWVSAASFGYYFDGLQGLALYLGIASGWSFLMAMISK